MPILSYFAVVGSVLVALLFVADATLEKRGPLPFNNEAVGLPPAWRPDPQSSILAATPAPQPDMTSEAVRAAAPPAVHLPAAAAAAKAEAVPGRMAKLDIKKPKRVARRQPPPPPDGYRQNYAWRGGGFDNGFFGGGMFGRF
jgi:hypothetical protein